MLQPFQQFVESFGGRDFVRLLNITMEDNDSCKFGKVACLFSGALMGLGEPNFYHLFVTLVAPLCLKFWQAT